MAQCAVPKTSDTIREAPNCETESVPAFRLSVDSLLRRNKGNGNGGNSVTTSKADEKPTAFQEACVEDSEPKSDRKGKIAER